MMNWNNEKAGVIVVLIVLGVILIMLVGIVNNRVMNEIKEMSQVANLSSQVKAYVPPQIIEKNNEKRMKAGRFDLVVQTDILGNEVKEEKGRRELDRAERRKGKVRESPLSKNIPLLQ